MRVEFVAGSLPCSERFFFAYSGFPLSSKNQHFQIPIQSGMHWHISMSSQELLSASRVNKLHFFFITILQFTVSWKFNISQKFIWVQSDFCAYNLLKKNKSLIIWYLLPWKIGCETKPGLFGEYGSGLIHSLGRHLSRNGKYELTEASRFTHPGIDLLQRTYKQYQKKKILSSIMTYWCTKVLHYKVLVTIGRNEKR